MKKRLLSIFLCVCLLLSLPACAEQAFDPNDANKLVIWHDKEDAVIAALETYLATAAPDLEIIFDWLATIPAQLPICLSLPMTKSASLQKWAS